MDYKIIADSSCDLTDDMKKELDVELVPLTLQIGEKVFIDDEKLNLKQYIKEMKDSPVSPKTACPSPEDFMNRYQGEESNFVITLSDKLSGTYNSATVAKNIYLEENKDKFIHVFNSKSASAGETLIALKIDELIKKGLSNEEVVKQVEEYIDGMHTFFLLESLEHLAKAGRLNNVVAIIASLLAIKPIMGATNEGQIKLVHKVRGYKKAFIKLADTIGEHGKDLHEKTLVIAHCNYLERGLEFKKLVEEKYNFKKIVVVEMAGLSSTYADDGGIVIAF